MPSYPASAAIANAVAVDSGNDAAVDRPTGIGGRRWELTAPRYRPARWTPLPRPFRCAAIPNLVW